MEQRTTVKRIQTKTRVQRLLEDAPQLTQLPPRENRWGTKFLQLDQLVRNLAVVAGLVLVLVAVRNSAAPEAQSVFGAIQQSMGMEWDESLGKLSFVSNLLPEEIQEVWNEQQTVELPIPLDGVVVHSWSRREPYLLIDSEETVVAASAEGEVLAIAHGPDEERIVRIRHVDGTEAIYGNLTDCAVEQGEWIAAGEAVGTLRVDQPLAFEVRLNGRSIEPTFTAGRTE